MSNIDINSANQLFGSIPNWTSGAAFTERSMRIEPAAKELLLRQLVELLQKLDSFDQDREGEFSSVIGIGGPSGKDLR